MQELGAWRLNLLKTSEGTTLQLEASASFLRKTQYWCMVGHPGTNPQGNSDSALKEQQMPLLRLWELFPAYGFAFFDVVTFRGSFHTLKQEEVHVILHFQRTGKEILLNF